MQLYNVGHFLCHLCNLFVVNLYIFYEWAQVRIRLNALHQLVSKVNKILVSFGLLYRYWVMECFCMLMQ